MTGHGGGLTRLGVLLGLVALSGCDPPPVQKREATRSEPKAETLQREPLQRIPAPPPADPRLVALGKRLFDEKKLSVDDTIACSSCHDLQNGGDDGRPRSLGVKGHSGKVNAPTVFNSGLNFVQFWNGRAATLEDQINGPVTHPDEMSSSWDAIVKKLTGDPEYVSAFAALFPNGVTADNIRKAIATFERTLVVQNSPFDRWLDGDATALSAEQKTGYELFKSVGCIACHQGANVGGNMFQRFGVLGDYFKDRGNITDADYGRWEVTKNEADRFVFRVPSLRMVAHTAPYFHDGSAKTLPEAVQIMAKYQLGRKLTDQQVSSIVAFLGSLSGQRPGPSGAR